MTKLKLGAIPDDKPVKLTVDLPANVHRDLTAYAEALAIQTGQQTLRATRHYGRAFWKRWTGYKARIRAEARMSCLKSFGDCVAARDPIRQTAEIHIRVALMNRFSALGTAEIVRVA